MHDKSLAKRLYVGFQFFFDLLVWLPVFYEFQRRMGLSDASILSIQSLYYLSFCLFEIPTGYFADRFGYRNSLRSGALVFVVANLLVLAWTSYAAFLTHFLFVALSRSLVSGAANAYLYEYLKMCGAREEYRQTEGRARAFGLIGKVFSWAAVGLLMAWHVTLPYWITGGAGVIAFILATRLPQLPVDIRLSRLERKRAAILDSKVVISYLLKSPYLLLLVLQGVGVFLLGRLQVTFFQPILAFKGFTEVDFGWIMAVMTIFEALGSYKPDWLVRRLSSLHAVFALSVGIALSFLGLAAGSGMAAVIAFCAFAYVIGLAFPIQKQLLNDAITVPGYRATILSIESMIDRGLSAWCITLFTGLVSRGEINTFLVTAAAVTLGIMALLYALIRLVARIRPEATAIGITP